MFREEDSRIDRIGGSNLSEKTIFIKTSIAENDLRFEGHFPERKILPGHWQLEMMCQAAVILVKYLDQKLKDFLPYLMLRV
ncbi:MAG: hypothetical protein V1804_01350 [Patescibacteria group bacterium]